MIEESVAISANAVRINKETSSNFNILDLFSIGETQHSYLLAYFLNPNASHGQNNLFLNIFLDMLRIKRHCDNERWIITAEKGRIDILLKREHPHAVVIIENKSNYAADQNYQLYRYWYQEIYHTICNKSLPTHYILAPPEESYQIIYLSPAHWKTPSTNTLTRPPGLSSTLPTEVPMRIKTLLFNDFVCQWLSESLHALPASNYRMREYVKQYIEYWS